MSPELRVTRNSVTADNSKDTGVEPKFVSIINSKRLGTLVETGKDQLAPSTCVGKPPPPCYGGPYGT